MAFKIIYITYPDEATANKVSSILIEKRLVACANVFPIGSIYTWKEKIESDREYVSIVKTIEANFEKVTEEVEKLHPYEVPCITGWSAEANQAYEDWIEESVDFQS